MPLDRALPVTLFSASPVKDEWVEAPFEFGFFTYIRAKLCANPFLFAFRERVDGKDFEYPSLRPLEGLV